MERGCRYHDRTLAGGEGGGGSPGGPHAALNVVRDPHSTDCPPTRWPESPRIVVTSDPWTSNGPDHLGLCALQTGGALFLSTVGFRPDEHSRGLDWDGGSAAAAPEHPPGHPMGMPYWQAHVGTHVRWAAYWHAHGHVGTLWAYPVGTL